MRFPSDTPNESAIGPVLVRFALVATLLGFAIGLPSPAPAAASRTIAVVDQPAHVAGECDDEDEMGDEDCEALDDVDEEESPPTPSEAPVPSPTAESDPDELEDGLNSEGEEESPADESHDDRGDEDGQDEATSVPGAGSNPIADAIAVVVAALGAAGAVAEAVARRRRA